ncbi:MAG: universal stress protein [Solirubrobacterales bacterium]
MSGTIVVGYDGRDGGDAALDEAMVLARQLDCSLALVFAYEPPARAGGEVADLRATLKEMGAELEVAAHEKLADQGIEHELVLIDSRPAPGLAQVAEERDARMVIVGGAGEAPLKGALLGATPHKLLNLTDRPVLVVRSPE